MFGGKPREEGERGLLACPAKSITHQPMTFIGKGSWTVGGGKGKGPAIPVRFLWTCAEGGPKGGGPGTFIGAGGEAKFQQGKMSNWLNYGL